MIMLKLSFCFQSDSVGPPRNKFEAVLRRFKTAIMRANFITLGSGIKIISIKSSFSNFKNKTYVLVICSVTFVEIQYYP